MMNEANENIYEDLPKEMFELAQQDETLHDTKLETKARGYFADALVRFRKNRASVIGAWIIFFLLLFSLLSPILSKYTVRDQDKYYVNYPPYIRSIAEKKIGIFDGAAVHASQNEAAMAQWKAVAIETGYDPLLKILETTETVSLYRGKERITKTYKIQTNKYYEQGMIFRVLSFQEFEDIQKWQDETGIQVIYPFVEAKDIKDITSANVWYQVSDNKGTPKYDKEGNFIPAYSTNTAKEGAPYHSKRLENDPGNWIYSMQKSGAVQCRVCYYNYYTYVNGHEPMYIMGTNSMGMDLFCAIGIGSRFSIIFALLVSVINLTIGAVYGAIQGYYGGAVDMIMDRIADILYEVPFIVVSTLFQLHLAPKVGVVPSFLFAFVLTGWIGMAALVRKQFYRFKSQEFVMAARTLGASDWRLMFKHIFPNAIGTIITSCALTIPGVIRSETTLTYLGIVNIADFAGTSLGTLMSQGQTSMTSSPHAMFFPAMYFALLLIAFNLFGNGLRDAFNPSLRGVDD